MTRRLESSGGFFIALPASALETWPGAPDGLTRSRQFARRWAALAEAGGRPVLVFGGYLTSFELVETPQGWAFLRQIFAEDPDAVRLRVETGAVEPPLAEALRFDNDELEWVVFDGSRSGAEAERGTGSMRLLLPLGPVAIASGRWEEDACGFVLHRLQGA